MEVYKIGNKVNGIIRAYCPGKIGDIEMIYGNQPYTTFKGATANITFNDISSEAKSSTQRVLFHNMNVIDNITISNIELTDKILNLIFPKSETKLANVIENYDSDENNEIFLNTSANEVYQVFIYNNHGELENAYGELDLSAPLKVLEANSNYLIAYSYEKELSYSLNMFNNYYLILDLEIIGNTNDETSHMWIHLGKCGLQIDKNMYFSQNSNAVDLTFKVIPDKDAEDYITLK